MAEAKQLEVLYGLIPANMKLLKMGILKILIQLR
jgi:hypothetical protein